MWCDRTFCSYIRAQNCSIYAQMLLKLYNYRDNILFCHLLFKLNWADTQLPCSCPTTKQSQQEYLPWLWDRQYGRGWGFYFIPSLHVCRRMWFGSHTMVTRTAVTKLFCLVFDINHKRCIHSTCNVVLFLFYIRTIDTCAHNRIKNWEHLGLTIFVIFDFCC